MAEHTKESLSRRLNWLSLLLVPGAALFGLFISAILSAFHALYIGDTRLFFDEYTIDFIALWVPGCAAIGLLAVAVAQTVRLQVERSYYGSQEFSRADVYPGWVPPVTSVIASLLPDAAAPFVPLFWCIVVGACSLLWYLRRAGKMKRLPRPGAPGIALGLWWLVWTAVFTWWLLTARDVGTKWFAGSFIPVSIYFALASLDLVSILQSHYDSQVKPPPEP